MENNLIVRKSNELVNASYDFSIRELRLFLVMVTLINSNDTDFKPIKIKISDFASNFNLNTSNLYAEIEKTTDWLLRKIIKIPYLQHKQQMVFKTTLVSSFTYNKDGSWFIEATFHPKLKPYLLELKNQYMTYNLNNVIKLSSATVVKIYELLKQYERIGYRTFQVEDFKKLLSLESNYERYYDLKKKVILLAQRELKEHTDLTFDFQELRGKNKVVSWIRFEIFGKKRSFSAETLQKLNNYGISPESIHCNEYTLWKVIHKAEEYFSERKKSKYPIQNKWAYLNKLLNDSAFMWWIESTIKSEKQNEKGKIWEQKLKSLKLEFENELKIKIQKLKDLHLSNEFVEKILEELKNNIFYEITSKERIKWNINAFLKSQIEKKLQMQYLESWETDFELRKTKITWNKKLNLV